jgi:hypothetical protein
VTDVTREGGIITVHVHYAKAVREHQLWEIRTELTHMTLSTGLSRDQLISTLRARNAQALLDEQNVDANRAAPSAMALNPAGETTPVAGRRAGGTGTDEVDVRTGTQPA